MTTSTPEVTIDGVLAAFEDVWESLDALLGDFSDSDFLKPTPCQEWNVRDVVAHIVTTESRLLSEPPPDVELDPESVARMTDDEIEDARWLYALQSQDADGLRHLFRDRTTRRLASLKAISDQAWNSTEPLFDAVGGLPYSHLMVVRILDSWIHEQDIRDATDRPGHEWGLAAEATVDAIGYLVGATPHGPDPKPGTVSITLTTAHQPVRQFNIQAPKPHGHQFETTAITMPVGAWTRLCSGRHNLRTIRDLIAVTGNEGLAMSTLGHVRNEW